MGTWFDENSGIIGEKIGERVGKAALYIVENIPQITLAVGKIIVAVIGFMAKLPVGLFNIAK